MKERFEVLDIFRGLFALMVVFFHLTTFTATNVINNAIFNNSDVFVDFFFVLSGFVIAHNYSGIASIGDFKKFYKKRFLRIYPLHLVMLVAFFFIETAKEFASHYIHINQLNNEDNNLFSFLSAVFLLNSVKLPSIVDVSWNMPSWSISAEMISYFLFGATMLLLHNLKINKHKAMLYVSVVLIGWLALYLINGNFKLTYSYDYGFLRGIIGFFTGALCYSIYHSKKNVWANFDSIWFTIGEVLSILLIFSFVGIGDMLRESQYIYEVLFFAAVLIFSFERGYISSCFKKYFFLHRVGQYSYSIYMTHAFILSLFNVLFVRILKFSPADYSYLFIFNFLLIYFVSKWTYKNIEMKFYRVSAKKDPENNQYAVATPLPPQEIPA